MLYLKVGHLPGEIYSGNYFDVWGENSWILDDFSRKVIRDIEHGEVISENNIVLPIVGGIPPQRLSGGTKALITINNMDDVIFRLSAMGDNCYKHLNTICNHKDVIMSTETHAFLFEFGFKQVAFILNNGNTVIVDNFKDWFYIFEKEYSILHPPE